MNGQRAAALPLLLFALLAAFADGVFAEGRSAPAGGHLEPVGLLAVDSSGKSAFSAAKDGCVVRWDLESGMAVSRLQLSPYGIIGLALRSNSDELAIVENDGLGLYRVSAWNFKERRKLFTLRFRDAVRFVAYSEKGSFLIVARNSLEGVVFLDPSTGDKINQLTETSGQVAFAATGKSERTMVTYSSAGELCYWNVSSGEKIQQAKLPDSLAGLALFGGGRFLFASTSQAILVFDAITAKELARKNLAGPVFPMPQADNDTALRFAYLENGVFQLAAAAVDKDLTISFSAPRTVPAPSGASLAMPAAAAGTKILSAAGNGRIALWDQTAPEEAFRPLVAMDYEAAKDAIPDGQSLIALVGQSLLRLPASCDAIKAGDAMQIVGTANADRLLTLPGGKIVFWKPDGSMQPQLDTEYGRNPIPLKTGAAFIAVRAYKDTVLFLDSVGTITIYDTSQRKTLFTYSAIGLLDAVIVDDRRLIVGKSSAVAPRVPLVSLNYRNGETVPIDLKGKAAVRLHLGSSGSAYAVIADDDGSGAVSRLVRFESGQTANSTALVEYRSEDTTVSIAEIGDKTATTLGKDGASILKGSNLTYIERAEFIPKRLISAGEDLLSFGDDGAIVWHDAETGKLKAVLRLLKKSWELTRAGSVLTGPVSDR